MMRQANITYESKIVSFIFVVIFFQCFPSFAQLQSVDSLYNRRIDSLDQENNRLTVGKLLFGGYTHTNRRVNRYWNIGGLLPNLFQFNTVEGFVLSETFDFNKGYANGRFLSTGGATRYGFSGRKLYTRAYFAYTFNRSQERTIKVEIGRYISQFNALSPISLPNNTATTLLGGQNFAKFFERNFGTISFQQNIGQGLLSTLSIGYEQRNSLQNTTAYSFRRLAKVRYTSNNPLNATNDNPAFEAHRAMFLDLRLRFNFDRMVGNESLPEIGTQWPVLMLYYRKGIPNWGRSRVDFDRIILRLTQRFLGQKNNETRYDISVGKFMNTNRLYFMDFNHFAGNQSAFSSNRIDAFFMMSYYGHSNDTWFVQTHVEHHMGGSILGKVPIFQKLGWHELIGARFLYTPELKDYTEINLGLENIFKIYRFDFILNYYNNRFGTSLRFGVAL